MPIENNPETIEDFLEREVDEFAVHLIASADRTAITLQSYIDSRMIEGASPEAIKTELLQDLRSGGRIFGEFRNAIKATAM